MTIISDNCWSNKVYEALGIEYQTPFISMFFEPGDYLKMVADIRWYLKQPLIFIEESRRPVIRKFREQREWYPIAMLGEVELQCLHYTSYDEVAEKWHRRLARMTPDESQWFYKFSDDHGCTPEQRKEFEALPFANKVFLTGSFQEQTDWKRFDGPKWVICP